MTDAEIDALANEILIRVVQEVHSLAPQHSRITVNNIGQPALEFIGASKQGHGGFRCLYSPFFPIKRLVIEAAHLFDVFELHLTDKVTGEPSTTNLNNYIPEHKDRAVKFVAEGAALLLVGSFFPRMAELLYNEFEDHRMFAKGILAEWLLTCLQSDEHDYAKPDMRDDLSSAVKRVADRRRESLLDKMSGLPNIVAKRGRGAPIKSQFKRQVECNQFVSDIKAVYRQLRATEAKAPTKTDVARELRIGGDPKRGGQSALQVFRAKLARCNIDYQVLTAEIENELNS